MWKTKCKHTSYTGKSLQKWQNEGNTQEKFQGIYFLISFLSKKQMIPIQKNEVKSVYFVALIQSMKAIVEENPLLFEKCSFYLAFSLSEILKSLRYLITISVKWGITLFSQISHFKYQHTGWNFYLIHGVQLPTS